MRFSTCARALTFVLFVIPFASTKKARCEADGTPSVALLSGFSDVIVVGTARPEGVTETSATLAIQVERVVKGNVATNSQLRVTFVRRSAGCIVSQSDPPVTALWFLARQADGTIGFPNSPKSQSCHPFLTDYEMPEGALPIQWAYAQNAKPQDKLAHELAWSIEAHQGDGPGALLLSADLLAGTTDTEALRIYKQFYVSSIPGVHMTGMLGLVRAGDADTLRTLVDNIDELARQPRRTSYLQAGKRLPIRYEGGSPETQEGLLAASVAQVTNPANDTVRQLGRILETSLSQAIRRAAARSLAQVHSALALTYLAPFLNDQNDPSFRAYAIGAIACFANGVPALDPSKTDGHINLNNSSNFKTEDTLAHFAMGLPTISKREDYYLDFWRAWWASNRAAVEVRALATSK